MDSFDDQKVLSSNVKQVYEQPNTHKKKKFCLLCLIFCCKSSDLDLTQNQLTFYYTVKPFCNNLYEESNPLHQSLLKDLYFRVFNKPLDSEDLNSIDWISLGFQSKNAQTDFRGSGLLGLENVRYFVINQKKIVDEMALKSNEFLFALTSLNISFHLKIFFHLADYLTIEKDKKVLCSREALKNFAKLLENGVKLNLPGNNNTLEEILKKSLYEMHEVLLIFCFKKWILLKKIQKDTTFMEFYKVFEEMKRLLSNALIEDDFGSIQHLKDYFEKALKVSSAKAF